MGMHADPFTAYSVCSLRPQLPNLILGPIIPGGELLIKLIFYRSKPLPGTWNVANLHTYSPGKTGCPSGWHCRAKGETSSLMDNGYKSLISCQVLQEQGLSMGDNQLAHAQQDRSQVGSHIL